LEDVYGVLQVLTPGMFPTAKSFYDNYTIRILRNVGTKKEPRLAYQIIGYWNLNEFRNHIEPVYYGRLQTDPEVQQALPEVVEVDVPVEMGWEQSVKVMEATNRILQMPRGEINKLTVLAALTRAQQLCNDPELLEFNIPSAKTSALVETLTKHLHGEKVIIHSKFKPTICRLASLLKTHGIESVHITGDDDQTARNRAREEFNYGLTPVLLMTRAGLKAGNLQAGGHIFFYDLPWTYSSYRQGVGRIKRTGSLHKRVVSYRMLALLHPRVANGDNRTVDHHILRLIQSKAQIHNVLTGDEDTLEPTAGMLDVFDAIRTASL